MNGEVYSPGKVVGSASHKVNYEGFVSRFVLPPEHSVQCCSQNCADTLTLTPVGTPHTAYSPHSGSKLPVLKRSLSFKQTIPTFDSFCFNIHDGFRQHIYEDFPVFISTVEGNKNPM